MGFKNFNVQHTKVTRTLHWLKENNRYYANIIIDEEILSTLPENGSVDDQLQHLEGEEQHFDNNEHFDDNDDNSEKLIGNRQLPPVLDELMYSQFT